jgi:hypothetical protein
MVSDRDIWRTASRLVERYGERAWREAVARFFVMKARGDKASCADWCRVADAVERLTTRQRDERAN